FRLYRGKRRAAIFTHVGLHITFRDQFDCTKSLTAVLGIVDMRDVSPIDLEAPLAPRRYFSFQAIVAQDCDKLLNSGAFSCCQRTIRLPVQHFRVSRPEGARRRTALAGKLVAARLSCFDVGQTGRSSRVSSR